MQEKEGGPDRSVFFFCWSPQNISSGRSFGELLLINTQIIFLKRNC